MVSAASAQLPDAIQELPEAQASLDTLQRDTPRGTVTGFLNAINAGNYERAPRYLDLSYLPEEITAFAPSQLALGLASVLERATWIDPLS